MKTTFYKYQGTGNDFIIIDNREGNYDNLTKEQVNTLCDRRFGIGADGLMLLNKKEGFDFEMRYYNSDGGESSMCGNGGRCLVIFAKHMGVILNKAHFMAIDGVHEATIEERDWVHLKMNPVNKASLHYESWVLNTGSPHYVKFVEDVKKVNVKKEGAAIRYSDEFSRQGGINVNFVQEIDDDTIFVRTYERGVEDETLSCGTGVTASALMSAHNERGFNKVEVNTPGGHLSVEFDKLDDQVYDNVWLCGPARFVYKGEIDIR